MNKLMWQLGKLVENWGIDLQAWADPDRTTREADETVKNVCMQNIGLVKWQVQQGMLSESEGERRINGYLDRATHGIAREIGNLSNLSRQKEDQIRTILPAT